MLLHLPSLPPSLPSSLPPFLSLSLPSSLPPFLAPSFAPSLTVMTRREAHLNQVTLQSIEGDLGDSPTCQYLVSSPVDTEGEDTLLATCRREGAALIYLCTCCCELRAMVGGGEEKGRREGMRERGREGGREEHKWVLKSLPSLPFLNLLPYSIASLSCLDTCHIFFSRSLLSICFLWPLCHLGSFFFFLSFSVCICSSLFIFYVCYGVKFLFLFVFF